MSKVTHKFIFILKPLNFINVGQYPLSYSLYFINVGQQIKIEQPSSDTMFKNQLNQMFKLMVTRMAFGFEAWMLQRLPYHGGCSDSNSRHLTQKGFDKLKWGSNQNQLIMSEITHKLIFMLKPLNFINVGQYLLSYSLYFINVW